jgi:predicted XRE-type DNA-binding protein
MTNVDPIPALKAQLGSELAALLEGWNADDVAVLVRTDRPRVSELRRGMLERFSLETLIRYLTRLRRRSDPARRERAGRCHGLTTGNSIKLTTPEPW